MIEKLLEPEKLKEDDQSLRPSVIHTKVMTQKK